MDWIDAVLTKQDHLFEHVESCLFLDSYGCHLKDEVYEHSYGAPYQMKKSIR